MFSEFDSTSYFVNLLALSILLLPIYLIIPLATARRILLSLAGAYLLYFIAPRLLLFYIVFWTLVFFLQRLIAHGEQREWGGAPFWLSILLLFSPMVVWKLVGDDFIIAFNVITHGLLEGFSARLIAIDYARDILVPIGLSFASFRGIDLLVKSHLGQLPPLGYDRVIFYGFFPPVQIVGPIIEYTEVAGASEQLKRASSEDIYHGLMRISVGIIKVFVIATLLQDSELIFSAYESIETYKIWLYLFIYAWFFYINFSGYSDLAIGTSRLYGYELKENFSFPFFRKNVAEFWNNWHMSLSRFAQRNAFIPLGGYRVKTQYLATLGTIMVVALWHDISLGMVLFGLYHGAGLILHRLFSQRYCGRGEANHFLIHGAKIAFTHLFIVLSFPLLALPLERAATFYWALFGGGA